MHECDKRCNTIHLANTHSMHSSYLSSHDRACRDQGPTVNVVVFCCYSEICATLYDTFQKSLPLR
jgi:hypothetical protein